MTRHPLVVVQFCVLGLLSVRPVLAQPEGQPCMAEPTDQLMVYGDHVHPCQINPVGDSDLFRFNGVAGERVILTVIDQAGAGSSPACVLELFRPNGSAVSTIAGNTTCQVLTTLDATGLFTLRISESGNDNLMTYGVQMERLLPVSPTATSINPGDAVANLTMDPRGDADLFVFNGVSGDTISLRVTDQAGGGSSPACLLELYGPDGVLIVDVAANTTCLIDRALTSTGAYTIRVRESGDDNLMTYNLEYQCILGSCPTFYPLTVSTTGAGSVTSNPIGIDCGADCAERYFDGTVVNLTPVPVAGAVFNGWSGDADCDDGIVTMTTARQCIASFSTSTLPPTTVADAYATARDVPLVIAAPGVLANDNSNGGGAMTAQLMSSVSNGALALGTNGGFTYTPSAGFTGVDSFTYRAVNTNGPGNTATVTLTVTAQMPPVAIDDAYGTTANLQLDVPAPGVLGNDNSNGGGAMTATLVGGPSAGSLALAVNGGFTFVPPANFTGIATFTYRASNAGGLSNTATVTITVNHPTTPQPPTELVVDSVQGRLVTVRFTPPLLGPAPTAYVLKGGVLPGQVLAALPTGHTAPVFTFLAPIGSFHIRMHTLANGNESGPSDEVPLHVGVPVPPSAPSRLTGMVNGSSVALAWKHTFEGGPASDALLDVTGSINTTLSLGPAESFSFPAVPGGTYTFRVRGENAGGASPPSDPVTLAFPSACSGVPQAPDNFLAYRVGATIFVMWDPPAAGPAPKQYLVTVTGAFAGTFPTTARMISGGVGPGTYGVSVRAANPCGTSAPTPEQVVTLP